MEADEIFSEVAAHMVEGMMFHDQMSNYYRFLGLEGFAKEQTHHFKEESAAYRKLCRYYVRHYDRLIPEHEVSNPSVIPTGWYQYRRQDVDSSTRRNAVSEGFDKWVKWETDTQTLYEKAVKSLYENGAVAGAIVLEKLTADVAQERATAEAERLSLEAMEYDPVGLVEAQEAWV